MKIKVLIKIRDIWKYYNKINQLKIRSILMNSKLILFCKFYKYSTKQPKINKTILSINFHNIFADIFFSLLVNQGVS